MAVGDLTRDGIDDAVITVACVPSTSTWGETTLLLDGSRGRRGAAVAFAWTRSHVVSNITSIRILGDGSVEFGVEENHGVTANAIWDRTGTELWTWSAVDHAPDLVRQDFRWNSPEGSPPCVGWSDMGRDTRLVAAYRLADRPGLVTLCATPVGELLYTSDTEAGALRLPAEVVGESVFEARNGNYRYIVEHGAVEGPLLTVVDGDQIIAEIHLTSAG